MGLVANAGPLIALARIGYLDLLPAAYAEVLAPEAFASRHRCMRALAEWHRRHKDTPLQCGTIDGARYVGLDGEVGSLEEGKLADLVVIDGDPLTDVRHSEHVVYTMLGGRLYDASTMNQIAPDEVERRQFFFEKEGGDTIHPSAEARMREVAERHHH